MVFRRDVIASSETLKDSETFPVDLRGKGALSALEVEITATNGSTYNLNNHIHDIVTRIEVVDGAEKYFALTGKQVQILNWALSRKIPIVHMDETPNVTQIGEFTVPFGHKKGDREWFLDVDKMKNPKLNVTFNIGEIATASATTAFVSGSGAITVKGIVDQEKTGLSQRGYLRSTEIDKWTTAASGDKVIELPTDFPYRMLFLRAYKQNSDPLGALNKLKLAFDSPKYTYLEEYTGSYMRHMHAELGLPGWVTKWIHCINGSVPEWPCMRNSAALSNIDGNLRRFISLANFWKGLVYVSLADHTGAGIAAYETHEAALYTWMFQNGLVIPFGDPPMEGEGFPAPSYKLPKLTIAQNSVGHAASVCVTEMATQ